MVEAYNLYMGGYLPDIKPRAAIHKKRELHDIYRTIVKKGAKSPLALVHLSEEKQAYALDVKEMSMELLAATQDAIGAEKKEDIQTGLDDSVSLFNKLLKRSDEYALSQNRTSRPGNELRSLVEEYRTEITDAGFSISDESFIEAIDTENTSVPESFMKALNHKSKMMSLDPMEYIDKIVCSYSHLAKNHFGSAYADSAYSGMLFNSYC